MLIKLIGGIIIILSSTLIGILLSQKYKSRPVFLKKFRFSMQMLETEVIYGTTPLPYALYSISLKSDYPWKAFFYESYENITDRKFFTMEEAWSDAMDKHLNCGSLNKADKEIIKNIGKVIGKSDREDQKKHFLLLYAQLNQQEERAEDERRKNERMYKSLGFLLGAAIYIILI